LQGFNGLFLIKLGFQVVQLLVRAPVENLRVNRPSRRTSGQPKPYPEAKAERLSEVSQQHAHPDNQANGYGNGDDSGK
jgi:hypothetical protein